MEDLYLNDNFNGQKNFDAAVVPRTGSAAHAPITVVRPAHFGGDSPSYSTIRKVGNGSTQPMRLGHVTRESTRVS